MTSFQKQALEPYGVVSDTDPLDVESEWTHVQNMRFNNNAAESFGGVIEGTTLPVEPFHLQFNGNHIAPLWIYMGNAQIHVTDFTTDSNITPAVIATDATNWTSILFNNFPVMNNEINAPYYWDNVTTNNAIPLPAFPDQTICKTIRPYRGFLVAMNIQEGAIVQENRVIWSDLSDNGALPASWDIADPTTLAGDNYLTQDRAEIIDGLTLRDFFVIYKTHSMILMRLTGGQGVMSFQKSQVNSGLLAKNCVQEFNGKHFIVTDADIVLFDGHNIESIADKRVRARIFTDIDVDNYRNSYVVRYDRQDEMWFCYPTTGQTLPNQAAVWNWKDNTWCFRDMEAAAHTATGLANFAISPTYDEATYTYDSAQAAVPYLPIANNPTTDTLITSANLGGTYVLGILDEGSISFNGPLLTTLEKRSMTMGDEDVVKHVHSVIPKISGEEGAIVGIEIGTQMFSGDDITWSPVIDYEISNVPTTSAAHAQARQEAYFDVKGRYISIRFTCPKPWKLKGLYMKMGQSGSNY